MPRCATLDDISNIMQLLESLYADLSLFGLPFELNKVRMRQIVETLIRSKMGNVLISGDFDGVILVNISKVDSRYIGEFVGNISEIYVREGARGNGIASDLYAAAENWLRDNNVNLIAIDVVERNPAKDFWRKMGFKNLSRRMYKEI